MAIIISQGDNIMKNGLWQDKEVKDLFSYVEDVKKNNQPLKNAFILHAKKYGRQPNSVRNYYYHEVDNLISDKKRAGKLNIDLKNHTKSEINYFSESEKKNLVGQIDSLVKAGSSVRKACLTLSNGDIDKMLRYQNKYRNHLAKNKQDSNIIKFTKKKKEVLTESDINSLFMGLVRLVKRSAVEEISGKMKEERESSNYLLRKALVDLSRKDKEIKELKQEFLELKNENLKLVENITKLRCDKAEKLSRKLEQNKVKEKEG